MASKIKRMENTLKWVNHYELKFDWEAYKAELKVLEKLTGIKYFQK